MANIKRPLVSFPTAWGLSPPDDIGGQFLPFMLEFQTRGLLALDFEIEQAQFQNFINNVQAVYILNNSAATITLTAKVSAYKLIIKSQTAGWYPWMNGADQFALTALASAAPGFDITAGLSNLPISAGPWPTA